MPARPTTRTRVLEALDEAGEPMTPTRIMAAVGLSEKSVRNALATLHAQHLVYIAARQWPYRSLYSAGNQPDVPDISDEERAERARSAKAARNARRKQAAKRAAAGYSPPGRCSSIPYQTTTRTWTDRPTRDPMIAAMYGPA